MDRGNEKRRPPCRTFAERCDWPASSSMFQERRNALWNTRRRSGVSFSSSFSSKSMEAGPTFGDRCSSHFRRIRFRSFFFLSLSRLVFRVNTDSSTDVQLAKRIDPLLLPTFNIAVNDDVVFFSFAGHGHFYRILPSFRGFYQVLPSWSSFYRV